MVVQKHKITTREFEAFIAQPEHADRRFELIEGEIVEKPMTTRQHGVIAHIISGELYIYLRTNPIGQAAVEARHRPTGDAENDRLPDVSFVAGNKPLETRGPPTTCPTCASRSNRPTTS